MLLGYTASRSWSNGDASLSPQQVEVCLSPLPVWVVEGVEDKSQFVQQAVYLEGARSYPQLWL